MDAAEPTAGAAAQRAAGAAATPSTTLGAGPTAGASTAGGDRSGRSPRDMAMSLAVLLVPILLVFVGYQVLLGGDEPVEIDPGPAYEQARSAGEFPVLEPAGLGPDWHPVSAGYRPAGPEGPTLRIGYVTADGGALQLVQSSRPVPQLLVAELTATAQPQGQVQIGAATWQWYAARPGERALVWLTPRRSVLLVGSATESEFTALATALAAR
ncbi:DUF4245 domain-containing protein [Solwaraspora sp. WMMA2056]|uniref:DUF4245 domain-containing protein n=1 Tax=Solwaraspora sp. WMMA2056 TaxID=3015161 RepID=UPI00259B0F69|nr:DUF4245 domain-containing protein [Solwaraspora sp. WMMA2056]WJK40575.1 DUF4245 domain-containing protein [Solwaraspora sp. WMMA2056]